MTDQDIAELYSRTDQLADALLAVVQAQELLGERLRRLEEPRPSRVRTRVRALLGLFQ